MLGPVDKGFRLAMWALQGGRVAIAAQALGIGEAALDEAIAFAKKRSGTSVSRCASYQAIQWMLADMATELDAARMLTWKAALSKRQEQIALEASIVLYNLGVSEWAARVVQAPH